LFVPGVAAIKGTEGGCEATRKTWKPESDLHRRSHEPKSLTTIAPR
jgi:hypothetical protein